MIKSSGIAAIRELGTLFNEGAVGMLSDGQLLDRFVERRDASAFEAIVERYGPLVWGVCRRVLRDHHDAEDAFQATFLVLARKAASIMPREKLGNWLYGVAFQTAMKARATRAKRRVRERQAWEMTDRETLRRTPGRVALAARSGSGPPGREVPHAHHPLRAGGEDPPASRRATRLARRHGIWPAVKGQGACSHAGCLSQACHSRSGRWECCLLMTWRGPACHRSSSAPRLKLRANRRRRRRGWSPQKSPRLQGRC